MDVPAGYELRAPMPEDLEAVAEVLVADQRETTEDPVLNADFLRDVWSRPGFELATDAWVVQDDAPTIVAYGQVRREESDIVGSWGTVHPDHRGRGIGASLFERIRTRASVLLAGAPSPRLRHSVNGGDGAAARMLADHGLHPVRYYWHMQIDLASSVEPGPDPEGIEIGGMDPTKDLPSIHAVLQDAFVDDWNDHPGPFDRWVEEETNNPGYDPTLWLVARDAGTPAGALIGSAGDDGGSVDWIAVLASHRGRGIGGALLRRSFAMFADRGLRRVNVSVDADNPTAASALYERVGMRVVHRWNLWEGRTA